jgi:hypothetical protein
MHDNLKKFFAEYEAAFQDLDIERQAPLFADTFVSAGPKGVIAQTKAEFLKLAGQGAAFYKSLGLHSAKILWMQEFPISKNYTMVNVHWGVKFFKTGDTPIEFDVSYLVHIDGTDCEIILFISHEDEQESMKKLGLINRETVM